MDPSSNESGDVVLPVNLFRGSAPLLRDVFLFGVHISGSCPAFRNVTKLALHPLSPPPLQTCLSTSIPTLETLVLSTYDSPQYTLSPGHRLTELTISTILDDFDGGMEPYLSALQHSDIATITLSMADADCMRAVLDALEVITSIEVLYPYTYKDHQFQLIRAEVHGSKNMDRYFPLLGADVVEDVLRSSSTYTAKATYIESPEFLLHAFAHHPLPLVANMEVAHYRARLGPDLKPSATFAPALKTILRQEHTPALVGLMLSADGAGDASIIPIDALPLVEALQDRTTTPKLSRLVVERTVLIHDRCTVTVHSLVGSLELFVSSEEEREINGWSDEEDDSSDLGSDEESSSGSSM
ncbi:hypothetical protein AURDEDRAFT_185070 [Auricularia subglabra TFB-10046 SS5]|nr:hypothetical protein AURDEDRAFT_185070 [Auricularia subglabra TFB-10046 SS5]